MTLKKTYFSLIEVIIAIGIIAGIMGVTYGFMRQGLLVREHSKQISRQIRLEHNLLNTISKDIQGAQWIDASPIEIFNLQKDKVHPSSSKLQMLSFSKLYNPETQTNTYLNQITYAIDLMPNGENYALYRQKISLNDLKDDSNNWEYIYGPITDFTVQVWDKDKSDWLDKFSSGKSKALPNIVQIIIQLPKTDLQNKSIIFQRKIVLHNNTTFKKAKLESNNEISKQHLSGS